MERHDGIQFGADLASAHAEDRPVEEDVLPPGEVSVESGADLDQRGQPPLHRDLTAVRPEYPRQQLEHRALARAVGADDAHRFAPGHLEAHVAQCPQRIRAAARCFAGDASQPRRQQLAQ